jgi:hypothetical protein
MTSRTRCRSPRILHDSDPLGLLAPEWRAGPVGRVPHYVPAVMDESQEMALRLRMEGQRQLVQQDLHVVAVVEMAERWSQGEQPPIAIAWSGHESHLHERIRWHAGQRWLDRFMNASRTIGVPQRGHGLPC